MRTGLKLTNFTLVLTLLIILFDMIFTGSYLLILLKFAVLVSDGMGSYTLALL